MGGLLMGGFHPVEVLLMGGSEFNDLVAKIATWGIWLKYFFWPFFGIGLGGNRNLIEICLCIWKQKLPCGKWENLFFCLQILIRESKQIDSGKGVGKGRKEKSGVLRRIADHILPNTPPRRSRILPGGRGHP